MASASGTEVGAAVIKHDDLYVQLSQDVDALMLAQKVSQRALARRAGVTHQTVINILKARPATMRSVLRVLDALGASFTVCSKNSAHTN